MNDFVIFKPYEKYFTSPKTTLSDVLKCYCEYYGVRQKAVVFALIDKKILNLEDLIDFINRLLDPDDEILGIYHLGEEIY